MSVIKTLALHHLPACSTGYEVKPFAEGAFNKLYLLLPASISTSNTDQASSQYIFRVALPVDPCLKTASEVATLRYISLNTSIPVPNILAYDSNAKNDLGFEWILMTRLPGVPLNDLWSSPDLTWEARVQLTKTVAGYIREMHALTFSAMGNIYLASDAEHLRKAVADDPRAAHRATFSSDAALNAEFVLGPICTIPFFSENRINLSVDRGPWTHTSQWLTALLNLHISTMNDTKANPPKPQEGEDDEDEGYDSDDLEELDGGIEAAQSLLFLISEHHYFQGLESDPETFIPLHDDLSTNNILIDPSTHRITGVVDWECVSVYPLWKAQRAPQFLYGPDIDEDAYKATYGTPVPDVPPPPDPKEEDDVRNEGRLQLEQMLLRRVFYQTLGEDERDGMRERIFENKVWKVDGWQWKSALWWAERVAAGGAVETEVVRGQSIQVWKEE